MKSTQKLRWLSLLFACLLSSCHAGEAPQDKSGSASDTAEDPLIRAMDFGIDVGEKIGDLLHGKPRQVLPGASPALIVENNRITLDGKSLVLEAPVAEWWKALGPPSRQDRNGLVHVWDKLGLGVTARIDERTTHAMEELTRQLYDSGQQDNSNARREKDQNRAKILRQAREFGNFEVSSFWVDLADSPPPDDVDENDQPLPRHAFPGYLEVNGVGVDGKSTLRDVFRWSQKAKYPLQYGCLRLEELRRCTARTEITKDEASMNFSFDVDETEKRHILSFGFSCERCPRPTP